MHVPIPAPWHPRPARANNQLFRVEVDCTKGVIQNGYKMGAYLRSVIFGHVHYYAVPFNVQSVSMFRKVVSRIWWRVLRRRSQRTHLSWTRMECHVTRWLPLVRICHPYPWKRFGVVT
jgi:RNA-directed DNA polymerase